MRDISVRVGSGRRGSVSGSGSVSSKVWRCIACRAWSRNWGSICAGACSGSAANKWARKVQQLATAGSHVGAGHKLMLSGEVIWCMVCGAYAEKHAIALQKPCVGPPVRRKRGGHRAQLKALRAGLHPVTREGLPPPQCIGCNSVEVTALIAAYRASPVGVAVAATQPLNQRMQALLERVRKREADVEIVVRRVRRRIVGKTTPGGESTRAACNTLFLRGG